MPGSAERSGLGTPSITRTGRRLTYWRKLRRMGMSSPHSDTWSGTPGQPTAPSRIASDGAQLVQAVGRHHRPLGEVALARPVVVDVVEGEPVPRADRVDERPRGGRTSVPMPSPGIIEMR